ncbi:MAG TPA: translocation/assembly module TamB domain-containing protein [Oculatellaceae cyanobacterium]
MNNSPKLEEKTESGSRPLNQRLTLIILSRPSNNVAIIVLLTILGGLGAAWLYIETQLAPLVEQNLTQTLNRPVQLGQVEGFSFTGLRFGRSAVPATPTDPDRLSVEAVDVGFNPLKLLFDRTLQLDVTLVKPEGYIEQDAELRWVSTTIKSEEKKGFITTDLQVVRVEQGNVVLLPFSQLPNGRTPVVITKVNGNASFFDQNQRISFDLEGQPIEQVQNPQYRRLIVKGQHLRPTQQTNLVVSGQHLQASAITRFVKLPSIDLLAGDVDGNLEIKLQAKQRPLLFGTAYLKAATIKIAQVPKLFSQTTGYLGFRGTQIQLQKVSTVYGQVPGVVAGVIDTQSGFNIAAQTAAVRVNNILNTLDLKLPVAASGEAQASINLTGALEKPVLSGTVVNTKVTQVDRIRFRNIKANFALVNKVVSITGLQALPVVGGQVTGAGTVRLGKQAGIAFNFNGNNLPADAIAQIYGSTPPINLGLVAAQGQVSGVAGKLQTVVNFSAPNATYPGSGEVVITPERTIVFRNTTFVVAGGTVTANGQLTDKNWQAQIQASNVPGQGLVALTKRQVPPQLQKIISGNFLLSGSRASFKPETINGTGSAQLQVAGGRITGTNVLLRNGLWQGNFTANSLQLGQLSPQTPANFKNGQLTGNFNLAGSLTNFQTSTITGAGTGRLQLANGSISSSSLQLSDGRWQGNFTANNLQLGQLSAQVPGNLKSGQLTGNFNLAGSLDSFKPSTINGNGTGRLQLPTGIITASSLQLSNGRWQGNFNANNVQLGKLSPQVPPALEQGKLAGNFNLSGSLDSFKPSTITGSGNGRLQLPTGNIIASSLQLNNGAWQGNFAVNNLQLGKLAKQVPATLKSGVIAGNFNLAGSLASFQPSTITGSGAGRLQLSTGNIVASGLQLRNGRWQGNFTANNVQLGRLSPQVPVALKQGAIAGNFNLSGSLADLKPSSIVGTGTGSLKLPDGSINASALQLRGGRWQGNFAVNNLQLGKLSPQVPANLKTGELTGNFNLSGSLADLKPSSIVGTGTGSLQLPDGSINASALQLRGGRWQGNFAVNNLQIGKLSPQVPENLKTGELTGNFNISGSLASFQPSTISATGAGSLKLPDGSITASALQLNNNRLQGKFAVENVDIQRISQLPALQRFQQLGIKGRVTANLNVATRLTAFDPKAVQISGQLRLENFAAEQLTFEPVLTGEIQVKPGQGVNLRLAGVQDRIELALSPSYKPESFAVRLGDAIANGTTKGNRLQVATAKIPISLIKSFAPLPANIASQPLSGLISGNFDINLATRNIIGQNVQIDQPIIASIKGDKLIGNFSYINGVAKLTNGEFTQGDNRYFLSGSVTPTAQGPEFQGQLKVAKGEVQDLLTALQIFELQDLASGFKSRTYGNAGNVQPAATGLPEAPLLDQLRRLSEIEALLEQQLAKREDSLLPELRDLAGAFSGEVNIAGSLKSGIRASFAIDGQNWQWDEYKADQVIVQGSFDKGVLTFLPLRIQTDQSLVAFSGTVGSGEQSGQLRIQNFPVEVLNDFVDVPVDITGKLNASATIAGSLENPRSRGEITIAEGTLNQTAIQVAQGSFSYDDARLNFYSTAVVSGTEPLRINGSVPYKLPFATKLPTSNEISVDMNVQNEGLALLNLLSRGQVAWVNGEGKVNLAVRGTVDPLAGKIQQLNADGIAVINNATVQAQAFPEPLTEVTGQVLFNFGQINVQNLRGKFSKGQVVASGIIPITRPQQVENPLTVALDQIALNIKGRYSGGVQGSAVFTGTALNPKIGGQIELVNGQVLLEETPTTNASAASGGTAQTQANSGIAEFNNLKISLGDGVQITRPPVLNFLAKGDLTINGTLDNIRPEGTVKLDRGQVNLFTTQFRLAGGYAQTAEFLPYQGLVPNLDVRLVAVVPETTRRQIIADPLSAEISDIPATNLGGLQTIRIEATVRGAANQFAENLELKSNPARGEAEIVALLGGGFVDTLGRGDTTLGLANLAGSAFLGNIQNTIGNAIGLSEFRLFPTVITNPENRTSTLGLGAEAGFNFTPQFSASILTNLTAEQLPQYSLRYRVNEETLLRGSTDLSGDSRATVEFEKRF